MLLQPLPHLSHGSMNGRICNHDPKYYVYDFLEEYLSYSYCFSCAYCILGVDLLTRSECFVDYIEFKFSTISCFILSKIKWYMHVMIAGLFGSTGKGTFHHLHLGLPHLL